MDLLKIEPILNLEKILVKRAEATFFVRVSSNKCTISNVWPGDLLIVDKSLDPANQGLAIVIWKEKFELRRLIIEENRIFLNNDLNPEVRIDTRFDPSFQVWGVVTFVIHTMVTTANRINWRNNK
ncbi:MAG: LexA family protein [Holosporales bacterium]